jgi:hypothetical protein
MRIDRLMVVQAAAGIVLWVKGIAFAGLCMVGAVTAVQVVPGLVRRVQHTDALTESAKPHAPPTRVIPPIHATPNPSLPELPASDPAMAVAVSPSPPIPVRESAPAVRERAASPVPIATEPEAPEARDPLEREAAILEEARAMIDRRPSGALAMLERHAALFPMGQLSMEREFLAVQALRRLGRLAEARARASALLRQAIGSIYETRVRAMIEELGSP